MTTTPTPSATRSLTPTPTPSGSATPSATATTAPLGVRRFTLDPTQSTFALAGNFGPEPLVIGSFRGQVGSQVGLPAFLDLSADAPDGLGVSIIDVVAASDYLYVDATQTTGGVLCLKPVVPAANAGLLACNGGLDFSLAVTQNHHLGEVGAGGFTAGQCTALGGSVEGPGHPHPGVCNGPYEIGRLGGDSGAGAVQIATVPELGLGGLPFEATNEAALPCGDEGPATPAEFAFTSAIFRSTILNFGNQTDTCGAGKVGAACVQDSECDSAPGTGDGVCGALFTHDSQGQNFSCAGWLTGTPPGCLVFSAPQLEGGPEDTDLVTVIRMCGQ